MEHTQFNLPTAAELQARQPVQSDFELKQANVLKTAKDLYIKEVFSVTNAEVSQKKGQKFNRTAFSTLLSGSVYSASTSDFLIGVTSLSYAPTIGLPRPSLVGPGKFYIVKDEAGGALTTTITVVSADEKLIDGAATSTIITAYGAKEFYSDGSNWYTK